MKFELIVSDPPWVFKDKLKQSETKRGAESQYVILKDRDIIDLDVKSICADNSVLALWVPSAKLDIGLETLKNWGFKYKQSWIWVKIKNSPLRLLIKKIYKIFRDNKFNKDTIKKIKEVIEEFDVNDILNFYMGHYFRQTHEICLIGTRGKVLNKLVNKAQRSVYLGVNHKHSEKPEELQNRLDIMFPGFKKKLEMFARRDRKNWMCVGLDAPKTLNEDIRDTIERLKS